MSTTRPLPNAVDDPAFRFAAANAAVVTALFGAAAVRLGETPTLALVAVVVALFSPATAAGVGPAIGLVAWAFYTGFVVHRYGTLSLTHRDVVRMTVLAGVGLATTLTTRRTARSAHRPRRR